MLNTQIEAVVLDRDGVLIDFDLIAANTFFQPLLPLSLDELSTRWRIWGKKRGFPCTLTEEKIFFQGFWNMICDELALSVSVRSQLYQFDYTSCLVTYPETYSVLSKIRQVGLKIGVLSNFALASLDASLTAVGLAELVDVACAAPVIGVAKPKAAAYRIIAQRLNVQPEACLFFDDEVVCVEGGRAVGMRSFLVDRQRSQHDIDAGVVCNLRVIPQILKDALNDV